MNIRGSESPPLTTPMSEKLVKNLDVLVRDDTIEAFTGVHLASLEIPCEIHIGGEGTNQSRKPVACGPELTARYDFDDSRKALTLQSADIGNARSGYRVGIPLIESTGKVDSTIVATWGKSKTKSACGLSRRIVEGMFDANGTEVYYDTKHEPMRLFAALPPPTISRH